MEDGCDLGAGGGMKLLNVKADAGAVFRGGPS